MMGCNVGNGIVNAMGKFMSDSFRTFYNPGSEIFLVLNSFDRFESTFSIEQLFSRFFFSILIYVLILISLPSIIKCVFNLRDWENKTTYYSGEIISYAINLRDPGGKKWFLYDQILQSCVKFYLDFVSNHTITKFINFFRIWLNVIGVYKIT